MSKMETMYGANRPSTLINDTMYTTHNAVRDTVEKILRRAGCTTVSEPVGELEPHIDSKGKAHELRVDIRADGLRANSTTLLLDTSITHIIGKAKDPASQPQARQGKSHPKANIIKAAETIKDQVSTCTTFFS